MSDIFNRLAMAAKSAAELPAIISEINALLPDGWEVRRCVEHVAGGTEPAEAIDFSDWKNWRAGDVISCVDNRNDAAFHVGGLYEISGIDIESPECKTRNRISIALDGKGSTTNAWQPRFFKFHSRPEQNK